MRVFHSLVFDQYLEGTASTYIDPKWNEQLGLTDKLKLVAITDNVTGTTTLNVQLEESADNRNFVNKSGTAEIIAGLTVGSLEVKSGSDVGTTPFTSFVRARIALSGTSPKAHVQLYITGRGEELV